jgi:hypothetical protein
MPLIGEAALLVVAVPHVVVACPVVHLMRVPLGGTLQSSSSSEETPL